MKQMMTRSALLLQLCYVGCAAAPKTDSASPKSTVIEPEASLPRATQNATKTAPTPHLVTPFDAGVGALPEGLAIRNGMAYIGFAPTGKIVRMTLGDGAVSEYSAIPTPAKDKGFMTGLEFDSSGQLYAALASFVEKPQAGIYRISASDNTAKLFAKHDQMKFPNGMAFAPNGDLYVTDSGAGAVFKVAPNGATSAWISHDLLKGEKDYCGKGVGASFDIGANGIVIVDGKIYVANNDRATIVRIPIQADGNAATPQVVAGPDCSKLGGADGLVADSRGNLILAVNRQNRIVRITPSGATETLAEGGDLDFPASVALSGAEVIATNFALFNAMSGKPGKPGIISLPYAN